MESEQTTATIKTMLKQRTLVVGSRESIATSFPTLADELLSCENITLCGELDKDAPVSDLWSRIEAHQPERLWIIGGDGTINLVVECLLEHNHPLPCQLTPAGTANDLSRALTERLAVSASSSEGNETAQQEGGVEPQLQLDLQEVILDKASEAKCFANMLTLGTSARSSQHVTEDIKSRWGALAYLTQIWKAIGDLEPFTIRMRVGQADERTVDEVVNLFVANGPYCGGGYRVSPPAEVDDGLMDVIIFRQGSTGELARVVTNFLAGRHLEHDLVEHFTADRLVIDCLAPSPLTLDGEAFTAQHIEVRTRPRFLPITLIPKE